MVYGHVLRFLKEVLKRRGRVNFPRSIVFVSSTPSVTSIAYSHTVARVRHLLWECCHGYRTAFESLRVRGDIERRFDW